MNASLRLRLVIIILVPLLIIAGVLASWAVYDAQARANDRFDRSLLSAALAVSRDIALSDGDALSAETNALLSDTYGGPVFYHVYAPDGVFVTGYATPPPPALETESPQSGQTYFDGRYQGQDVRVLKYTDAMQIDGLSGEFTFTLWQTADLRRAIVRDLSWRTFQIIAILITAVALIVWFGVRYGLRPLLSLEAAIERRSPDDLTAIKRQVPVEAKGIVATLNRLLAQVSSAIEAKDVFISNAAHQLRNPIAGVVAMSDALQSASTLEDMKERSDELAKASRRAGDLANKLLALERASGRALSSQRFDLTDLIQEIARHQSDAAAAHGVSLNTELPTDPIQITGDATMVEEAITNLVENALLHGGDTLSKITISLTSGGPRVRVKVADDGQGISPQHIEKARERFGQVHPSEGSGLGLAIAEAVAQQHGGSLSIQSADIGLTVELSFPA